MFNASDPWAWVVFICGVLVCGIVSATSVVHMLALFGVVNISRERAKPIIDKEGDVLSAQEIQDFFNCVHSFFSELTILFLALTGLYYEGYEFRMGRRDTWFMLLLVQLVRIFSYLMFGGLMMGRLTNKALWYICIIIGILSWILSILHAVLICVWRKRENPWADWFGWTEGGDACSSASSEYRAESSSSSCSSDEEEKKPLKRSKRRPASVGRKARSRSGSSRPKRSASLAAPKRSKSP